MEENNNYVRRTFVLDLINEVNSSGGFKSYSDYSTMFDLVDNMPAADVQTVKHGKWEISSDGYYPYCSECKSRADGKLTKYCGECGTRMDGDTE